MPSRPLDSPLRYAADQTLPLPLHGLVLLVWIAVLSIPLVRMWRAVPHWAKRPQVVVRLRAAYLLFVTMSFVASTLLVTTSIVPGCGVVSVYAYYLVMVFPSWVLYLSAINTGLDGLTIGVICGSPLLAMFISSPVLLYGFEGV